MRIIKATGYGYRTVIVVCLNSDAPEWVHVVGRQFRDGAGQPVFNVDGTPRLIQSPDVPDGETGESCHNCRSNWEVREFVFDGEDQYRLDDKGLRVRKVAQDYLVEVTKALSLVGLPMPLSGLVGEEV